MKYAYLWRNPDGTNGKGNAEALNDEDFLRALNVWNCGEGRHYWSTDSKVMADVRRRVGYVKKVEEGLAKAGNEWSACSLCLEEREERSSGIIMDSWSWAAYRGTTEKVQSLVGICSLEYIGKTADPPLKNGLPSPWMRIAIECAVLLKIGPLAVGQQVTWGRNQLERIASGHGLMVEGEFD